MFMNASRWHINTCKSHITKQVQGGDCPNRPPKTNESYFIYLDFVQFGKQYSQYNSENSIRN